MKTKKFEFKPDDNFKKIKVISNFNNLKYIDGPLRKGK